MGSTADKAKGLANEAVGNIKQGVGKATDNDKMRAEGVVQEKKGEAQQAVGKTKDAVDPWTRRCRDRGGLRTRSDGERGGCSWSSMVVFGLWMLRLLYHRLGNIV